MACGMWVSRYHLVMLTLIVEPSGYGARGQLFDGLLDGEPIAPAVLDDEATVPLAGAATTPTSSFHCNGILTVAEVREKTRQRVANHRKGKTLLRNSVLPPRPTDPIDATFQYREWRTAVFESANYTCSECESAALIQARLS